MILIISQFLRDNVFLYTLQRKLRNANCSLDMFMYVCVFMCVHVCVRVHVCSSMCACSYVFMYVRVFMSVHVCGRVIAYVHACVHVYVHVRYRRLYLNIVIKQPATSDSLVHCYFVSTKCHFVLTFVPLHPGKPGSPNGPRSPGRP